MCVCRSDSQPCKFFHKVLQLSAIFLFVPDCNYHLAKVLMLILRQEHNSVAQQLRGSNGADNCDLDRFLSLICTERVDLAAVKYDGIAWTHYLPGSRTVSLCQQLLEILSECTFCICVLSYRKNTCFPIILIHNVFR